MHGGERTWLFRQAASRLTLKDAVCLRFRVLWLCSASVPCFCFALLLSALSNLALPVLACFHQGCLMKCPLSRSLVTALLDTIFCLSAAQCPT